MKNGTKAKLASPVAVAVFAALTLSACGESSSGSQGSQFGNTTTNPPTPGNDFNQQQLVTSVVNNAIVPTYTAFKAQAEKQAASVKGWCDAQVLEASDLTAKKTQAQADWRAAMDVWQKAEVMQIGPLKANDSALRNKIYSWPNTSSCAVDQEVVLSEAEGYSITSRTSTRRGMDALAYLMFNDNLNHSCTIPGTEPQGWDSRTNQARLSARCEFAKLVANDLVKNGEELIAAWQGDNGYGQRLIQAGQAGAAIDDIHKAVNEISDGMFYIDSSTKDAKIATPLGLFANDCGAQPCAKNVESPLSHNSMANIISNLQGLDLLFRGGSGANAVGFDDYLVDVGDGATAVKMQQNITNAIQKAQSFNVSLAKALDDTPDEVTQLHGQVKNVTDVMKADFINSLALKLPATSAGDND